MKTYSPKAGEITREWFVVDAADRTLGRLAASIARVLQGKHKAMYVPHLDTGDFVVVINASKLRVTGKKLEGKVYYRHTGRIGGLKSVALGSRMAGRPEEVLRGAVKGMLPKSSLGRSMLAKLKIYAGEEHPHAAQGPSPLEV